MELKYFNTRGTVREFSDRRVPASMIRDIVEAAAHAPNTGNMQLYSVVSTTSEQGRARLAPLHFNQPAATGAPVILTVCADIRRFGKWCAERKAVSGLDNFGGWLSAVTDAAIFAQQIVTAAEMNGLGTCYLGTAVYNIPGFAEALSLPEGVMPIVGIALGYPEKKPEATHRLPVEAVLHEETYHDPTPEEIETAYAEKERLEGHFAKDNGKETLAQVYADIRYPRALNETVGDAALSRMGLSPAK